MKTISVILPTTATVARLRSLNRAIESVLSQQDVTVDLIVVANGPRCDPEILDSLAKRLDVRLVYAEEGNYPAALRLGRDLVEAPFFAEPYRGSEAFETRNGLLAAQVTTWDPSAIKMKK